MVRVAAVGDADLGYHDHPDGRAYLIRVSTEQPPWLKGVAAFAPEHDNGT